MGKCQENAGKEHGYNLQEIRISGQRQRIQQEASLK